MADGERRPGPMVADLLLPRRPGFTVREAGALYAEAIMVRSTVFKTNCSQVVRLPEAVALPDSVEQVEAVKQDKGRLILPAVAVWDDFFESPGLSEDFMAEREQPARQQPARQQRDPL